MANYIVEQIMWMKRLSSDFGVIGALNYRISQIAKRPTARVSVKGTRLTIRLNSTDSIVVRDSLGGELTPLKNYLAADFDGLIIDAGAYIGSAALKLAEFFPKAQVFCVEASEANYEVLQTNTANHPRIRTVLAALHTEPRTRLALKDRGTGEWGFTIVETPDDAPDAREQGWIDTITLSEIFSMYPDTPVGLLKLDIEGGEKALFDAAGADLAQVPLIFVELHDRILSGCSTAFQRFSSERSVKTFGGEKFLSIAEDTQ